MAGCSQPTSSDGDVADGMASGQEKLKSGTYMASSLGRAGEISMEFVIDKGCILQADVVKNQDTATISEDAIATVTKDIIRYQTSGVDTVTGATLTSLAIKQAAADALGQAGASSEYNQPPTYPQVVVSDSETDVVVVGSGSAGMSAAARLANNGVKVILVEKQGFLGGGDTMFASSGMAGGGGYTVYKNEIENSSEQDYLDRLLSGAEKSGLPVDTDNLTAYALRSGDAVDYYISIGVPFGSYNNMSNLITDGSSPGTHIIKHCAEQMDVLGVDYRVNTKLTSIVVEGGKATGIGVGTESGDYKIKAKAVLLACGGFARNNEMLTNLAEAGEFVNLPRSGAMAATGDGILAAQEVGAELYNLTAIKANCVCHEAENGAVVSLATIQSVAVLVSTEGKRFVKETGTTVHDISLAELKLPGQEAWAVFDQSQLDAKKLLRDYDALGYFVKGGTWKELATAMGLTDDATVNFVATMEKWQSTGKGNVDEDFGSTVNDVFEVTPYYAVHVKPAMQSTYGGVKTDAKARVIDTAGSIIPGLFAAGAVSGHGCFGNAVGNGLTIASAFGLIAADTITEELA